MGPREQQRSRRLTIFSRWSDGGTTFAEVGREFGLTRMRTRQIILKAVMDDGCRSERARAWMAQLDTDGYWLRRYEANFKKGRPSSSAAYVEKRLGLKATSGR
jgi:hypothetical protein